MKNYGHRFASGVAACFFISIICILKNIFGFDYFDFCKNALKIDISVLFLAIITFFFAIILDNLVEKYELTQEKRDAMYFSIMGISIVISILSFVIRFS